MKEPQSEIEKRYWEYVEFVAEKIVKELKKDVGGEPLDGREFCEKHSFMETTFADAVNHKIRNVEYGVSPIYPFRSNRVELV